MIRQSFIYDAQVDAIVPHPTDDSYRQKVAQEREEKRAEREREESFAHPGIYL